MDILENHVCPSPAIFHSTREKFPFFVFTPFVLLRLLHMHACLTFQVLPHSLRVSLTKFFVCLFVFIKNRFRFACLERLGRASRSSCKYSLNCKA